MAWTNPKTWTAEVLTSADMNKYISDNLSYLKASTRKLAFHTEVSGAAQDAVHVHDVAAGILPNDLHVDKVGVTLESAPGVSKTVTVTVSDGTTTMTVAITGDADTSGSTTTNHYDWDVSEKPLQIRISAASGTAAGCCSVIVVYHEITIT